MTIDARALVAIVRKEPGCERFVEAVADDENPRVPATALAEAAMLLAAWGDDLASITIQIVVDRLRLTVVPFTEDHWKEAVREYERVIQAGDRPALGRCLGAAVAARLGAPVVT